MTPFIDLIRIISRKDERQMDKGKKGQRGKWTKGQEDKRTIQDKKTKNRVEYSVVGAVLHSCNGLADTGVDIYWKYTNTALSPQVHLPDEECTYCGSEFPAIKIRSHQIECVKRKENREDDQDCKGTKRKLESEMTNRKSGLEQKTESTSPRTEAERGTVVGEHQTKNIHQQNISIKYGSSKYSVGIEPERKMERVMRKLAKMVVKQVDKLVFVVEKSGKVITGEETMRELVGEVIVVKNV